MSNETDNGHVGRSRLRVEDDVLLRGEAQFVDDIHLPGMLMVAFRRSERAHARIASIDTSEATRIPGVHAVLTAADIAGVPDLAPPLEPPGQTLYNTPRPLLARDRVLFVGEAVVAALADSRYAAEDACDAAVIDYEDLPAVATPEDGLAPDAPLLHPVMGTNVIYEHGFDSGGVDRALQEAPVVFERTFRVPRESAAPLEPRGVLAEPTEGGLTVWTSTQAPHQLQKLLARVLELDLDKVRVICPSVGGGFGQKAHVYPEEVLIPYLALRFGRPVKWMEDRNENLIASSHARGQVVRVRVAASSEGELIALDADVTCDMGAYGVYPHGYLLEVLGTPVMMPGPYRFGEFRFKARVVSTNKCPGGGGYRGVGLSVSAFVHERVMDIIADLTEIDHAEARRRNLVRPEELPYTSAIGMEYDSGNYIKALDDALARIGYDELAQLKAQALSRGHLVGAGLCSYVEYTGMGSDVFQGRGMVGIVGYDEVQIALQADGTAIVSTSLPSAGQGLHTTFAQLVADELHMSPDSVQVALVDTTAGPDGTGTFASRSAVVGGGAAIKAAETLRKRMLELAERELEAAAYDLELVDGYVQVRGAPDHHIAYGDLVARAPEGYLTVRDRYDPPVTAYSYGTHACVVEIDPRTGGLEILRYAIVEDCGRVINPMIVEGQTQGAAAQGVGAALLEAMEYDSQAQPLTGSFMDYLLPTAPEVPRVRMGHLDHRPFALIGGFKGVGEGGIIGPPPALANAVSDATGIELNEIPLTPERIKDGCRRSPVLSASHAPPSVAR